MPILLVVERLNLLRMERPIGGVNLRRVLLMPDAGAGTIFADEEWLVRKGRMELVDPLAERLLVMGVPAEVAVETDEIGNHGLRIVVGLAAMGIDGRPGRILLFDESLQFPEQRRHSRLG